MSFSFPDQQNWNEAFASELVGKTLLAGIEERSAGGATYRREQVFGEVVSCDPRGGIVLRRADNGETFVLPPILEAIRPGEGQIYDMTGTGDHEITAPDYVARFFRQAPPAA